MFLEGRSRESRRLLFAWLLVLGSLAAAALYTFLGPVPKVSESNTKAETLVVEGEGAWKNLGGAADEQDPAIDEGAMKPDEAAGEIEPVGEGDVLLPGRDANIAERAALTDNERNRPWRRFAAAFDPSDTRPWIAIVVTDLGLSSDATENAIVSLPAEVTLSFMPYGEGLTKWIGKARADGHEVMLDLPMEPYTFPVDDPGPKALSTTVSQEENLKRLNWILEQGRDYIGLTGYMGSRFTTSRQHLRPVFSTLKVRGLLYLDNRPGDSNTAVRLAQEMGVPRAMNNRTIDEGQADEIQIRARLAQIERVALTEGFAVALAHPFPVTIKSLEEWIPSLVQKGFALAPLSALANRQPLP